MRGERFDAKPALAQLKRFQRRTVDYVFDRLHGADQVRQFLVADEVGLGKTMVARGVIARTIEKLWDDAKRIDILYICSNQAIAQQNLNRLNVIGKEAMALPTRITLVPLQLRGDDSLASNKVNFISLTPGTTFNLKSTTGVIDERALLVRLLEPFASFTPLRNALQVGAGDNNWDSHVEKMTLEGVDETIVRRFRAAIERSNKLQVELAEVCRLFDRRRGSYQWHAVSARNVLVGELRKALAHACVSALKPDLIILDEFQRFRELLRGDGDAGELARALFEYGDDATGARTLLLSATPYKMLTLSDDDPADGDHYADFLETVGFLHGRERAVEEAAALDAEMRRFRKFLQLLPASTPDAKRARKGVERRLRRVMSRTERVGSTTERDSMLTEPSMSVTVCPIDLHQAVAASRVALAADAPDTTEYWKSAPYLLNFMRDYTLKRRLKELSPKPDPALVAALTQAETLALRREAIEAYEPIDPANGRLRALMADLFDAGLDQQLWIAPSLAYYGPATTGVPATKALIFSTWQMVPDAISSLVSYEVERRMGSAALKRPYSEAARRRPLQFRLEHGRPAALRSLNLIYPSPTLARLGDPLAIFAAAPERPGIDAMRATVRDRIVAGLGSLYSGGGEPSGSRDWEWSTAASVDAALRTGTHRWLADGASFGWTGDEAGFREHVGELRRVAADGMLPSIGGAAVDLMVEVALGSPAVCALRALRRIAPELAWHDPALLESAALVAWGFRTLFNQHEAVALLRQQSEEHYWRSVLAHCAANNLQAVLDEYAHYLVDGEGLSGKGAAERVAGVAKAMASALFIRPSQIDVDDVGVEEGRIVFRPPIRMRGRFAMRLAEMKDEEGGAVRLSTVREAFNSPFRPFVLATTSIGQEGLDFHPYCHRVYHWNLPGNPVDLEQREGRVQRFKGHAVRLNVAAAHADAIRNSRTAPSDPWEAMFAAARRATPSRSELVPYWIYEGPAKIERRVPMLPFSRETTRLAWLKRSLAIYRLAFGQPRQDDLLAHLTRLIGEGVDPRDLEELQIKLQP